MNIHRARYGTLCAVLAMSLCACGEDPPPPAPRPPVASVPVKPPPVAQPPRPIAKPGSRPGDIDRLITIANEDFAAQRFVAPPTANALEGFLEVRELDPDNNSVREAMVDLYPLAIAAVRTAIDARDLAEAERILGLVERGMPDALGVAELRAELATVKASAAGDSGTGAQSPATSAPLDTEPAEPSTSTVDENEAGAVDAAPAEESPEADSGESPPP